MIIGHFYFIDDNYYTDYPDPQIMSNHETINGIRHDRPCYIAIVEFSTGLAWAVPISSQVNKFQKIYNSKIQKHGYCDTIAFADVLGQKRAFLFQNMCPITQKYVKNEYVNNSIPVTVSASDKKMLISKGQKVLALHRQGKKVIFPDVLKIEQQLLKQLVTT